MGKDYLAPWVCPPCRRGHHAACMEPVGAPARICLCSQCASENATPDSSDQVPDRSWATRDGRSPGVDRG